MENVDNIELLVHMRMASAHLTVQGMLLITRTGETCSLMGHRC